MAFRLLPILTVTPLYRYQRYPGNPNLDYENRILLDINLSKSTGSLRPTFRTRIEGRFPEGRVASARLRFRPGIEYTLPLRSTRPPVLIVTNEFFVVPGTNSFSAGGAFTQNRVQFALRQPVNSWLVLRPYYMIQFANPATGWETNEIFGLSMTFRIPMRTTTP